MRMILSLSALVLSVGASATPPQAPSVGAQQALPSVTVLKSPLENSPALKGDSRANCRGRIETARAERGLPPLQRDTAKAGEPLFIAAVDKLIDGCEVLVMRNNLSDIRPLPEFEDGPGELTPLH
jgi:hypothetical protein